MATGAKKEPTADEQIARLRSEVARLRSQIRKLKSGAGDRTRDGRPGSQGPRGRGRKSAAAPQLPPRDPDGNYPAAEALRAILAQQIVRRRKAARWTQAQLAAKAGVRPETVSRIESGKDAPDVAAVDRLDRALRGAGV